MQPSIVLLGFDLRRLPIATRGTARSVDLSACVETIQIPHLELVKFLLLTMPLPIWQSGGWSKRGLGKLEIELEIKSTTWKDVGGYLGRSLVSHLAMLG